MRVHFCSAATRAWASLGSVTPAIVRVPNRRARCEYLGSESGCTFSLGHVRGSDEHSTNFRRWADTVKSRIVQPQGVSSPWRPVPFPLPIPLSVGRASCAWSMRLSMGCFTEHADINLRLPKDLKQVPASWTCHEGGDARSGLGGAAQTLRRLRRRLMRFFRSGVLFPGMRLNSSRFSRPISGSCQSTCSGTRGPRCRCSRPATEVVARRGRRWTFRVLVVATTGAVLCACSPSEKRPLCGQSQCPRWKACIHRTVRDAGSQMVQAVASVPCR